MPAAPDLDQRMRRGDPSVWPRWRPGLIESASLDAAWHEALSRRGEHGFPSTIRAYTHFAYCESSCNFCMYWHQVPRSDDAYGRHTTYLVDRVRWFSDRFGRLPISSAYFGGGTPTAPPIDDLARYLEAFSGAFDVAGEFSVEGHPNVTTSEKIALLGRHGVKRLSMGLQTLEHEVLVRITRRNAPMEHLSNLVRAAHDGGMVVNLDLILGLPGQTLASFRSDVKRVMTLGADVVTLYLYEPVKRLPDEPAANMTYVEAFTDDLHRAIETGGYDIADEMHDGQRSLRLQLRARRGQDPDLKAEEVYAQFDELPSHTIALGPGAYGHVFGRYWYREVTAMETLEARAPQYFGSSLDPVDECRTILLDAIERQRSLDLSRVATMTGVDLERAFAPALAMANQRSLLQRDGTIIRFTPGDGIEAVQDAIVPESPGPGRAVELDETLVELELVATRRDEGELARSRELLRVFREQLEVPGRGHQICRSVWVGTYDDTSIEFHVGTRQAPALRVMVLPPGSPAVVFSSSQFALAYGSRPSGAPNAQERRFLQWLVKRALASSLRRRPAAESRMVLDRPPAWASTVNGAPPRGVSVGGSGSALTYELVAPRTRSRVVIPIDRGASKFTWSGVSLKPAAGDPKRLPALAARPDFRDQVHRHAWVLNAFTRGRLPTEYSPTTAEAGLAVTVPMLSDKDAALALPADLDLTDPYLASLPAFVAAVNGDWTTLFDPSLGTQALWLAPAIALLNGDVAELQRLAGGGMDPLRGRPVAFVAGTVFEEIGFLDIAVELIQTSVEHLGTQEQADVLLGLGQLLGRMGRFNAARDMLRRTTLLSSDDPRRLRRTAGALTRTGALDDAYLVLQDCHQRFPDDVDVATEFLNLLLLAGEWDRATALLDSIESRAGSSRTARFRGAIAVERRELDRAVELLSAHVGATPDDTQARTWLCEALIRQGDVALAQRHHSEARAEHDSAVHILLQGAMTAEADLPKDRELHVLLGELGAPLEAVPPGRAHQHILETLSSFRGCRGEVLARVDPTNDGPTGMRPLELLRIESRLSSRIESADAVKDVVRLPVERVFARFEDIIDRYPESAHPLCYRGEVKLWLGDYAGALADFDAAADRHVARWSFVGRAAVHLLEGQHAAALEQIRRCDEVFEPVPSATTNIYLGEMYRRQGDLENALEHLDESLRVKPGRLSAWLNLAMVHRAAGREHEARSIFERVTRWAPRLLWDAGGGSRPGFDHMDELFETALTMMRGNRSSHCVTYFDRDGVFRQVHDAGHWQKLLGPMRFFVWAENRRRLLAMP